MAPAPTPAARIDPAAVYTEGAIAIALDISLAAIRHARGRGDLRYVRRGRRVLIHGRDLLAWLSPTDQREGTRG